MNLPGDTNPKEALARMLRVDHAGEYGAARIYAGQLAVLGEDAVAGEIRSMAAQEAAHLAEFNRLLIERRVRPSALLPFWHVAGYALGAGTAMLGPKAAMACTVAVESVIAEHYQNQLATLPPEEKKLHATIHQFRDEEMAHHDTGLAHDAESAPAYALLSGAIRRGCKAAIWLAERV
jgi:ubiquinone biosynthesis monooxygenase Coq7